MDRNATLKQAATLVTERDFASAEPVLLDLLALFPEDGEAHALLGTVFLYTGREKASAQSFMKAHGAEGPVREALGAHLLAHLEGRRLLAKKGGGVDPEAQRLAKSLRDAGAALNEKPGVKLSACLVVRNEERHLERCLASVRPFADEIVVVDTGSTDRTIEIARSFRAKVLTQAWDDDFSAARNAALEAASGDWALVIDADEELIGNWEALLKEALSRPHFSGYHVSIHNRLSEGRSGELYVHTAPRLFQRRPGVVFTGKIHEQVAPSLLATGRPIANLEGAQILHHGYAPTVMREKRKIERDLRLLEQEVRANPNDSFQLYNLASALMIAERPAEAEHVARLCVGLLKPTDSYGAPAFLLLTESLRRQGRTGEILAVCEEADRRGFGGILIEFARANALFHGGRHEQALRSINRCISFPWPVGMPGDYGILTHKRHALKAKILRALGRNEEAAEVYQRAEECGKPIAGYLYGKAVALEQAGRFEEALALYEQGEYTPEIAPLCMKGIARIAALRKEHRKAASLFEKAWQHTGDDYEAWLGWAKACEAQGDADGMQAAYAAFSEKREPTPEILINWGRALTETRQYERALECFIGAIKRSPSDANAYFNAGDLLYRLEHYGDAAGLYETALRHEPDHAQGWFVLGNCMAQLDAYDQAQEAYKKALKLHPDHPQALHNLRFVQRAIQKAA